MGRRAKPTQPKVKAKLPVSRKPPKNEGARVRDLEKRLAEALEQQTAASELLKVIGRSSFDLQPVFETLADSAVRLCAAERAIIYRFDGRLLRAAVIHNPTAELRELAERAHIEPDRGSASGRAILEGRTIHIHDVQADPEYTFPAARLAEPIRTVLAIPMLRADEPLGVIVIYRHEVRPFSDSQITLMETFAEQAVIAIENVRLFTELEARNRELTTALDQQTATSGILRVISRSQTDVQPVFDAIVESAVRLLQGYSGALTRIAGNRIELAALTSTDAAGDAALRALFPQALHSEAPHAQAIRDRAPLSIANAETDPRVPEAGHASARLRGYRSLVAVPVLHHEEAVGAIAVSRREPGGFTDDEIALLQTFADQAVIAIENVRLFRELEVRNRDLTEALEQQTATAEVLRVISTSPTNLQPVLDTLVRSTARFCGADDVVLFQRDGDSLRFPAHYGPIGIPEGPSIPLVAGSVPGRAVLERRVVHVADVLAEAEAFPAAAASGRTYGHRTTLAVPLLREGAAIGALLLRRAQADPFTDKQVALLQTFADQALIAIENVRLFTELQEKNRALTQAHAQVTESLEQQTATSEILRVIAQVQTDVRPVFDTIVRSAARLCQAVMAAVLQTDGRMLYLPANYGSSPEALAAVRARYPRPLDDQSA